MTLTDLLGVRLADVAIALEQDEPVYVTLPALLACDRASNPFHQCGELCPPPAPPADWSALAGKCETCRGVGRLGPGTYAVPQDYGKDCPGCDGSGKARHVIEVECTGKCNGSGVVSDWQGEAIECPPCDGYGTISYTVEVELVLVVSEVPTGYMKVVVMSERGDPLWWEYGRGDTPKIDVIGVPSPGDFVAVIRKVVT